MSSISHQARLNGEATANSSGKPKRRFLPRPQNPRMYRTTYTSLPVSFPSDFLAPLSPSGVKNLNVKKIDFADSVLTEYKGHYAVVIDGVLSQGECDQLIRYAEMSAGGHGNGEGLAKFEELKSKKGKDEEKGEGEMEAGSNIDGWHRALVRAGADREMLALQYRDSDRIVWQQQEIATKIWRRICQAGSVAEELAVLEGDKYRTVLGAGAVEREERWKVSDRGCNESLKFLRYGKGQYFREHRDGTYETPDGSQRSFYTMHLYLNDSVATTNPAKEKELISLDLEEPEPEDQENEVLEGGATTFHSRDMNFKLDVDPKAGRILVFQQRGLLHSGDEVVRGIKYTMRSDIMYEFDDENGDEEEDDIVFG